MAVDKGPHRGAVRSEEPASGTEAPQRGMFALGRFLAEQGIAQAHTDQEEAGNQDQPKVLAQSGHSPKVPLNFGPMPHQDAIERPHLPTETGKHSREEKLAAFGRLLDIMDDLRERCPWDRKQTFESLRHLTIEETYELADAILDNDLDEVGKEVGDLMLHMVFYSRLGSEAGRFDAADVLHGICDKLVHRHPHIYGDVEAATEDQVKANWEKIKLKEKGGGQSGPKGVLDGVPRSLPSMVKAQRIQEKVRGVGFDWDHAGQVWEKVQEELGELRTEIDNQSDRVADEFGDVLFALINYARFLDVNPDEALERTNRRFKARFEEMERRIAIAGEDLASMPLQEMDRYWDAAKEALGQTDA